MKKKLFLGHFPWMMLLIENNEEPHVSHAARGPEKKRVSEWWSEFSSRLPPFLTVSAEGHVSTQYVRESLLIYLCL